MSLDDVLGRFLWAEDQLLSLDSEFGALRHAYDTLPRPTIPLDTRLGR